MLWRRWVFIFCYGASGVAALVYQVAWVRMFTLTLGHTVAATSTVLAAFMGGLAAGAWATGRFPAKRSRILAAYAGLELTVAVVAIALPAVLALLEPLLIAAYADATAPARFAALRLALSLLVIGVPSAAMGATFPIAVAWFAHVERSNEDAQRRQAAVEGGVLYTANTAGAAAGAVAAGFWLIPALGVRGTTWVAVALNVLAASGALWLARAPTVVPNAPVPTQRRRPSRAHPATPPPNSLPAYIAAVLSGLAALVCEVAWTRLLALIIGPTTYAFAIMAASFILGIALGSSLGVRLARRNAEPVFWLPIMLVATAACTLGAAWWTATHLPLTIAHHVAIATEFGPLVFREAITIVLVLLPASVSLGATFTLALASVSSALEAPAREAARVYAANTAGAIAGALSAGLVLIPRFGLQTTFLQTSRVLAVAGVVVAAAAMRGGKRRRSRRAVFGIGAAVATVVATLVVPDWDRELLASGAYKYSRQIRAEDLESSLRAGQLEYYREGAAGTVSVRRLGGTLSLAIDGKVDASNGGDMLTQRLLGILPVLLHPGPRDALVIGLGSGVTADAVMASEEIQQLDILEISPEVVEASRYFDPENRRVLGRPGVRLLIGDGRSHLQLAKQQYDVIVSEPSNPWMAGVASLFTREFFETARARLRPGGVICQWAHTYEIAEQDLRSIVHTFTSVFPDGTMWLVGDGDLLLIGTNGDDIESRLRNLADRRHNGTVSELLAGVAVPPNAASFVLFSLFAGGPTELASYGHGAAVQTDDRMSLEYTAARAMYAPPLGNADNLRALRARATIPAEIAATLKKATAEDWTARGAAALRAEAFGMAHESFRQALALNSRSAEALRGATESALGTQQGAEDVRWLRALVAAEPDNAPARVELSHVLAIRGDIDEAIAAALEAGRIDPARPEPLEQVASIFADVADGSRLAATADTLLQRFPEREDGQYYHATALFFAQRVSEAESAIRRLLKANPRHAKGQNLLGVLCASQGNSECARTAFAASLQSDPRDSSVYVNLGRFYLEYGDAERAAEYFREALAIDVTAEAARRGLAEALRAGKG